MVISEEVVALAPREVVWKVLTTPSTWPKWWGGAIQSVEPGWEEQGYVRWEKGAPSRIGKCTSNEELVLVGDSGTQTRFQLTSLQRAGRECTSIRYDEDYSSSRLNVSDPSAVRGQIRSTLMKLMAVSEIAAIPHAEVTPRSAHKKWWQFWD